MPVQRYACLARVSLAQVTQALSRRQPDRLGVRAYCPPTTSYHSGFSSHLIIRRIVRKVC